MELIEEEFYYDGFHWTSWSQDYGCPNANLAPFGIDETASVRSFCRGRGTRDKKPESLQFRFCTLPNVIKGQNQPTWIYANALQKVNQYPTPDKPIKSIANKNHAEFSFRLKTWQGLLVAQGAAAFLEQSDDFRKTAGPAGEDEQLEFSDLFVNERLERQSIWSDPVESFASNRLACDPRLEESAKKCYHDAFDGNGDFLNIFCTHIPGFGGYNLDQVQTRKGINRICSLIHFKLKWIESRFSIWAI